MRDLTSLELSTGLKVHIQVINNRKLTITPSNAQYELLDENGKLVGLDYGGEYLVSKGSVLQVGKQKYKISEIKKSTSIQGYELYTFRKITTTSNFIFPLLGGNRLNWRWNLEFTNAFIGDEENHDGTEISLLYRFAGTKNFSDFEGGLTDHPTFMESYDPDKFHTLYKFKLPTEYVNDIKLIMAGKYSQISAKAKARIIEFHNSSRMKPIGQVLYRCEQRRKKIENDIGENLPESAELLDMFTIENEIYKKQFIIPDKDGYRATTSDFV